MAENECRGVENPYIAPTAALSTDPGSTSPSPGGTFPWREWLVRFTGVIYLLLGYVMGFVAYKSTSYVHESYDIRGDPWAVIRSRRAVEDIADAATFGLLSALAIAVSIGLFRLKTWARRGAIVGWPILSTLFVVIATYQVLTRGVGAMAILKALAVPAVLVPTTAFLIVPRSKLVCSTEYHASRARR